jgi:hypothetical protein
LASLEIGVEQSAQPADLCIPVIEGMASFRPGPIDESDLQPRLSEGLDQGVEAVIGDGGQE